MEEVAYAMEANDYRGTFYFIQMAQDFAKGDKVIRTTEATLVNHADFMSFHSIQRMGQKKKLAAKSLLPSKPASPGSRSRRR